MKIERLSRLFESIGGSSQQSKASTETKQSSSDDEAVKVSPQLTGGGDATNRANRVAQLKEQVASGTYKPESKDVAAALARDLLA